MNFLKNRPLAVMCSIFIIFVALSSFLPSHLKLYVALGIALCGIFLLPVYFFRKNKKAIFAFSMCAVALFALFIGHLYFDENSKTEKELVSKEAVITAKIDECIFTSSYRSSYEATVLSVDGKEADFRCVLSLEYPEYPDIFSLVKCKVIFREHDSENNNYYKSNGLILTADSVNENSSSFEITGKDITGLKPAFRKLREIISGVGEKILTKDSFALFRAVFLGDRSYLSRKIKDDFSRTGVSHMLALSGMHLSILIGGIVAILGLCGLNKRQCYGIGSLVLIMYVFLTGAHFSVIRAGIMFLFCAIGCFIKRDRDSITALFFAFAIIVLFSPYAVFNAGLILSFTSTLGILVIMPYFNEKCRKIEKKSVRFLVNYTLIPIGVSLSALCFSVPMFFVFFDYISVFCVVANLVITIPLSLLLMLYPVLLLLYFIYPPIGGIIGIVCNFFADFILGFCADCASLDGILYSLNYPFVKYIIGGMILLALILILTKRKSVILYLLVFALGIGSYGVSFAVFNLDFKTKETVCCISNAGNDGIILLSNGNTLVCDVSTGSKEQLNEYFDAASDISYNQKADLFVVTHYHKLLSNNIEYFLETNRIAKIAMPMPVNKTDVAVSGRLLILCVRYGVGVVYYSEDTALSFENSELCFNGYTLIKRSKHPVVEFSISNGEKSIIYLSPGFGECESTLFDKPGYDIVFAGGHGPKVKTECEIPFGYSMLICSRRGVVGVSDSEEATVIDGFESITVDMK